MPQKYMTPLEVASLLRVEPRTLETWRYRKQGPTYVRVNGQVRYERSAVDAYLAGRTVAAR